MRQSFLSLGGKMDLHTFLLEEQQTRSLRNLDYLVHGQKVKGLENRANMFFRRVSEEHTLYLRRTIEGILFSDNAGWREIFETCFKEDPTFEEQFGRLMAREKKREEFGPRKRRTPEQQREFAEMTRALGSQNSFHHLYNSYLDEKKLTNLSKECENRVHHVSLHIYFLSVAGVIMACTFTMLNLQLVYALKNQFDRWAAGTQWLRSLLFGAELHLISEYCLGNKEAFGEGPAGAELFAQYKTAYGTCESLNTASVIPHLMGRKSLIQFQLYDKAYRSNSRGL